MITSTSINSKKEYSLVVAGWLEISHIHIQHKLHHIMP